MSISIRNAEVDRKVRGLARLTGRTLTATVGHSLDQELARQPSLPRPRPTIEELRAATDKFRRAVGLDKVKVSPMTKRDWDALWPIGIPEIDVM
jgi:antitoxin VapB